MRGDTQTITGTIVEVGNHDGPPRVWLKFADQELCFVADGAQVREAAAFLYKRATLTVRNEDSHGWWVVKTVAAVEDDPTIEEVSR